MKATHRPSNLHLLKKNTDASQGFGGGGYLRFPPEFDKDKYAASWVAEDEVAMMKQDQPVLGTSYTAPGWTIWKYPAKDNEGVDHPKANLPHKVNLSGKVYWLMVRNIDVHAAVNEAYGAVSRDRLDAEITGQALSVPGVEQDKGMLSNAELERAGHRDSDVQKIGATVLQQTALAQAKRITPKTRKVNR